MKRISLIIMLLLLLGGCSAKSSFTSPEVQIVIKPDSVAQSTADGYKEPKKEDSKEKESNEQNSKPVIADITYYANTESKKFHLPTCYFAQITTESKLRFEKDYSLLISEGYVPCQVCKP